MNLKPRNSCETASLTNLSCCSVTSLWVTLKTDQPQNPDVMVKSWSLHHNHLLCGNTSDLGPVIINKMSHAQKIQSCVCNTKQHSGHFSCTNCRRETVHASAQRSSIGLTDQSQLTKASSVTKLRMYENNKWIRLCVQFMIWAPITYKTQNHPFMKSMLDIHT